MKSSKDHPRWTVFHRVSTAALACSVAAAILVSMPNVATAEDEGSKASIQVHAEAQASIGQDEFTDVVQRLLANQPEEIVDFRWLDGYGSITVKPGGEREAATYAANAEVKILVDTARENATAYNDRSTVELAVLTVIDDVRSANALSATYEPETDSVVVTAWTKDPTSVAGEIETALGEDTAQSRNLLPIQVEYESADDPPTENSLTRGGKAYGGCTGGFIGNRGSTYGIITSAHCTSKPSKYNGDTTGASYTASNNRDVRFTVLSGGTPKNEFYYDGVTPRVINSVGTVSTGLTLHKYGRITGYGSAKVESYKGCVLFTSGNTWCNLYYTDKKVTQEGDSGGPWFVAYKGYGFTTGSNSGGSYITPVAWISSISGTVKVKTS